MRIGIVLSKPPGYSETFFINKIRGLQKSGIEVLLFVQKNTDAFDLCKVICAHKIYKNKYLQFFASLVVAISLLPYLGRVVRFIRLEHQSNRTITKIAINLFSNAHILKGKGLDWIHFGFATLAIQSEHVAHTIGAKMAVSLRGFDVAIYPLKYPRCYELLWTQVDKVHTISDDLLNLAYELGLPRDIAFKKITPAINLSQFTVKGQKKPIFKKTNIQFLTVARLHWKKGLLDTLEALATLKDLGYVFKYTIVGEGPLYEELMFTIHQLRLVNEVYLVGKKNHIEIVELLKNTDIYLQYSISEGFCNAVLEAQAMGCLCIVSNAEGLSENILDQQTGWVVCKNKPKLLTQTIDYVLKLSENERAQICNQARSRINLQFNMEKQINDFIQFYSIYS